MILLRWFITNIALAFGMYAAYILKDHQAQNALHFYIALNCIASVSIDAAMLEVGKHPKQHRIIQYVDSFMDTVFIIAFAYFGNWVLAICALLAWGKIQLERKKALGAFDAAQLKS